jgi:glutamate-1-semialdehyde aminotransferase
VKNTFGRGAVLFRNLLLIMPEPYKLKLTQSFKEFERARQLIPGGVLGIRRPYNFVEGEYPVFFEQGKGARVLDVDGNEYIDFLCAYGPIIIGYREAEIDQAVIEQIQTKGFCFSLTQVYQNQLAKEIARLVPCAEMTIFVKTGSDATTLAVRLARAFTGRTKIMRCGYHGWHDWCVEVKGGIPEKLYEDVYEFHYNDLEELEGLLKKHGDQTAAIVMTPLGHPLAAKIEEPKPGFLEGVKALSQKYGVVLVYDEVRTGFRVALGGAQEYYKVTPDLACIGKAMANGYAISAVTGRADIMKKCEKEVFVSSTFFPNSLAYIASLKTIEILKRDQVLKNIWAKGKVFLKKLEKAAATCEVGAEVSGIPPMFFVTFKKDPEKKYKQKRIDFYTQLIRQKVFMQPYHHGYIAYRHTEQDLDYAAQAVRDSLDDIQRNYCS